MAEKLRTIELGQSGLKVSEIGCGGIPIMRVGPGEAYAIIRRCFQLGIRFFDTAHVYSDSEEKMGSALEPVRDEVVLATKVWAKDAAGAAKELAMSLERLRTKRIDLIQCHNVSNQPDLDRVLGPGGAYEVLARAKAEGKVRAIGLSSHNPDIAVKAIRTGKFATLQFPFNFIEDDPREKVFPVARELGLGLIAMKPLANFKRWIWDLSSVLSYQSPYVTLQPLPPCYSTDIGGRDIFLSEETLVTAIILLAVAVLAPSLTFGFRNEPDGFRGIKWGTEIAHLPDLVIDKGAGDLECYRRKSDNLKIDLDSMCCPTKPSPRHQVCPRSSGG